MRKAKLAKLEKYKPQDHRNKDSLKHGDRQESKGPKACENHAHKAQSERPHLTGSLQVEAGDIANPRPLKKGKERARKISRMSEQRNSK